VSVIHDSAIDDGAGNRIPVQPSVNGAGQSLNLIAEPDNMIGAAIDILTVRHQVSREEAAELLEQATDGPARNLDDVAKDVVLLGLPSLGPQTQIQLRPTPPGPLPGGVSAARTDASQEPAAAMTRAEGASSARIAAALLERLVGVSSLPDVLTAISHVAAHVVPGCDAACVTVLREGAPAEVVSADDRVRHVEETQYRHGEGPYLQAARTGKLVRIDEIRPVAADSWARAALEAGFTAVLSVPVLMGADTAATLSLYGRDPRSWCQDSLDAAKALADHAGNTIALVLRLITTA